MGNTESRCTWEILIGSWSVSSSRYAFAQLVPFAFRITLPYFIFQFSSVQFIQSLSYVQLFVTSWTTAHQASLSITISQSLLKFMSIESVMLSNHLIICCPLLLLPSIFPSIPISQLFASGGRSIGASPSVLPMNIQGWFSLGLTGLISLQSKGLSRVFSSTTIRMHQFFGTEPSLWSNSHICTWLLEKPQLCSQSDISAF